MATFTAPKLENHDAEFKDLEAQRRKITDELAEATRRLQELHANGTAAREQKSYSVRHVFAQGLANKPGLEGGREVVVAGSAGESIKLARRMSELREQLAPDTELMRRHASAKRRARSKAGEAIQSSYSAIVADAAAALARSLEPLAALEVARRRCELADVPVVTGLPRLAREMLEDAAPWLAGLCRDGIIDAKMLPPALRELVEARG